MVILTKIFLVHPSRKFPLPSLTGLVFGLHPLYGLHHIPPCVGAPCVLVSIFPIGQQFLRGQGLTAISLTPGAQQADTVQICWMNIF